ncbi:MAG: Ig-like domain-containing protein [Gemmatimonadota bacterium]|nr:Ig-like domain-containing protein [Candidatus Palauibacter polyketidifaciens]
MLRVEGPSRHSTRGPAPRLAPLALACIAWAHACGGDRGTGPPAPRSDPPRPTTVTVSPATSELSALGATVQLSAEVRDQNGQVMGATVTWSSNNTPVATVSASGLATADGNGTATITATVGAVAGSATVTVAQQVSAVALKAVTGVVLPGTTLQLAAEAWDSNGHAVDGSEFVWASSDTTVAVVDEAGLVTGIRLGEVEISATSSGATGRAQLEVVEPAPTWVAVSPDTAVFAALRDTLRPVAEVQDQAGRPMPDEEVTWTASDSQVATVDAAGLVTAVANGAATITATSEGASGEMAVEVMQVAHSLTVTPSADTLLLGDSLRLAAEALDANGHLVIGAPLDWSSGDPSVVTVDAAGVLRGVGEGTAEITAAIGDVGDAARISVFSPDRASLMALYEATNGDAWTESRNWASERPLSEWFGVAVNADRRVRQLLLSGNGLAGRLPPETGDLRYVEFIWLDGNDLSGPIPPELGGLGRLRDLSLQHNDLSGPIPPELGRLSNLEGLRVEANALTGPIPPELGDLEKLDRLWLSANNLTGPIPPELGGLSRLRILALQFNALTGPIPPDLGNLSGLELMWLNSNRLTGEIPGRFGNLAQLVQLRLEDNNLEGAIPPELGRLQSLERLLLHRNALTGSVPGTLGNLARLQLLSLSHNALAGPLPPELSGLVELRELRLNANPGLSGFLPTGLANLGNLATFLAEGTSLCAPADADFLAWLGTVANRRVARCRNDLPAAYLVQAVQSLDFPVPLIANRPALLRVFLTAPDGESVGFPPVRARFYLGGEEVHAVDIPAPRGTVPAQVGEGSLRASANAEVPADVLQPGLELVIEVDPDNTLGAEVGITRRIPESGRQTIDVRTVPPLHLTYLPVLRPGQTESGFLERIARFTVGDPMFWPTRFWLPVAEFTLEVRETFFTSAADGSELLHEIEATRVMEGGRGYYMGGLPSSLTLDFGFGGVAFRPGRSSLAQLDSTTVAHELGHNMDLRHAPCGGADGPDPDFPDRAGKIGAWGFDPPSNELVPPETADVMGNCHPRWISTYDVGKTLDRRLHEEASAAFAAAPAQDTDRTLLVWGGVDASGVPFLDPAFVVDAPVALPRSEGPYTLRGRTAAGAELFSIDFGMPEVVHGDGGSVFVFALPVTPAWANQLEAIELSAPGGIATLDEASSSPTALLRDPRTGRVRGILRDLANRGGRLGILAGAAGDPGRIASALREVADFEVLVSRGLPSADQW